MALEMRVYEELTSINPKIVLGLTGRQLVVVALWVFIGGPLSAGLWYLGWQDAISRIMILVAIPGAIYGWVRPMGLPAEVYIRHVIRYLSSPRLLIYRNRPVWPSHNGKSFQGVPSVSRKKIKAIGPVGRHHESFSPVKGRAAQ